MKKKHQTFADKALYWWDAGWFVRHIPLWRSVRLGDMK